MLLEYGVIDFCSQTIDGTKMMLQHLLSFLGCVCFCSFILQSFDNLFRRRTDLLAVLPSWRRTRWSSSVGHIAVVDGVGVTEVVVAVAAFVVLQMTRCRISQKRQDPILHTVKIRVKMTSWGSLHFFVYEIKYRCIFEGQTALCV